MRLSSFKAVHKKTLKKNILFQLREDLKLAQSNLQQPLLLCAALKVLLISEAGATVTCGPRAKLRLEDH